MVDQHGIWNGLRLPESVSIGERTVTLVVILGVPITALPIAIATAVVIPTGAMISSVTTVVSFTRLGRSNSYQRLVS